MNSLLQTRKKVLLAEDYYVNQKLFKTILNNLNIDVVVANNGKEASDAVDSDDFDLIFMDIQMPVMNGFQATEKIREKRGEDSCNCGNSQCCCR